MNSLSNSLKISVLMLFMVALILTLHYSSLSPTYTSFIFSGSTANHDVQANESNELKSILDKAVMKEINTVIITTLNAAWSEPNSIFDLFLESFKIGKGTQDLVKHLVVGTTDQKAYSRCLEKNLHCYALNTCGVDFSGEARFMTGNYVKLVWTKVEFQQAVVQLGYNFIFTDVDVMWLRNPFTKFYPDGDLQFSCNHNYLSNYTDLNNWPNTGFIHVTSNNRTIQFYNYWYNGRHYYPGKHDQDVVNLVKYNPFIKEIGLKMWFLDTAYFGGFCEPSRDLDQVITMHGTCCAGLNDKMRAIQMVINDWKRYITFPTDNSTRSWTSPRICG